MNWKKEKMRIALAVNGDDGECARSAIIRDCHTQNTLTYTKHTGAERPPPAQQRMNERETAHVM